MKIYSQSPPFNFLGLEKQNLKKAKVLILPIFFEQTSSNLLGTKFGPEAIILASKNLETFDEDLKKELNEESIFTLPPLSPSKDSPQKAIKEIERGVFKILKLKKFLVVLGGEHTITFGVLSAFKKFFKKEISLLQFDAHCDLRESFEGTKFSHACVARRILKDLKVKICQVGVRSLSKEEFSFLKRERKVKVFFKRNFDKKEILSFLGNRVYLTIDIDCLDPSLMPAVSCPEPEGLFFEDVLEIVKEVSKEKEIVGMDLVELCPIPGIFSPNFVAAKLIFKILGILDLIF